MTALQQEPSAQAPWTSTTLVARIHFLLSLSEWEKCLQVFLCLFSPYQRCCAMKASAVSATSRQPWSIVRECPRPGISRISVTEGLRFWSS